MRLPPLTLTLTLIPLLTPPTLAVLVVETSTSTYTAAPTTTTSSPSTSSSTSPPASAQYTSDALFESAILNSTNTYRAHYNASSLTWNASLATYASAYAAQCIFNHSHSPTGGGGGENIAEGYDNATAAVEAWGEEGRRYDFHNPNDGDGGKKGDDGSTGHFSQLVWRSTESVGCGRGECRGRNGVPGWLVVCEYWPAGNVEGEFGEEVGRVVRGRWEAVGGGRVAEEIVGLAVQMNGAGGGGGRVGMGKGLGGLVVVGVVGMVVVAWGV